MLKRGQLFQIAEVRANETPAIFKLKDLMGDILQGFYYREQLTKSPKPKLSDYFEVEKILQKRKFKGKQYYFVKYLYYPNKFNQWVPKENFSYDSTL